MCEYSVSVHERPGSRGRLEGREWYELFLFWVHTLTLASLPFSACHIGNSHLGNHAGDYMRSERAWMVSVKHYTEQKACEWQSKLTSLKRDACYTEKKIQVSTTFPSMCSPPHFVMDLWNVDEKCWQHFLQVREKKVLPPGMWVTTKWSWWRHSSTCLILKTFRLKNALEFVRSSVQQTRI